MSARMLRLTLAWLGFALFAAIYVWVGTVPVLLKAQPFVYLAAPGFAAVAALTAVFLSREFARWTWLLFGLAAVAFLAGESYYAWYQALVDPAGPASPSFADACFLLAYPLLLVGIFTLAELGGESLAAKVKYGADALLLMVVSFSAAAMLAIRPADLVQQGAGVLELVVRGAYPVLDLWLLAVLAVAFFGVARGRLAGWKRAIPLALVLWSVADLVFNYMGAADLYRLGDLGSSITDVAWMAAYFALGVGAVTYLFAQDDRPASSGTAEASSRPALRWWDLTMSLVVVGSIVLFATLARSGQPGMGYWDPVVAIAAVAVLMALRSTALAYENGLLSRDAATDALTGLYSHRLFHERLAEEVERAGRSGQCLTLVSMDLDGFGDVNTRLGHVVGDAVLRRLARRVRAEARAGDVVCRTGGDEFGLLLPATDAEAAEGICARLLAAAGRLDEESGVRLALSAGVATFPTHAETAAELLRKADGALYWAKVSGRGKVVVYDGEVVEAHDAEERIARVQEQSFERLVAVLADAVDARDPYTQSHSRNVARYAAAFARHLGYATEEVKLIETAALLHDVGKIGVPDAILSKPSALEPAERERIEAHPAVSAKLLRAAHFSAIVDWVGGHHEAWDGTGYPRGLAGKAIPREARIIALCDAYDAMISDRPYRHGRRPVEAMREIRRCAGTQFDPQLVEPFIRTMSALLGVRKDEVSSRIA